MADASRDLYATVQFTLIGDGWRVESSMDLPDAACPGCGHAGLSYQVFTRAGESQGFVFCSACGWWVEHKA
jgi:hypothetical protein